MAIKPNNTKRLVMLGLPIAFSVSFVTSGLFGILNHVIAYSWSEPEMFGWIGAFLLFGIIGLMITTPSHVIFLIHGVVSGDQPRKYAVNCTINSLIVGSCTIFLADAIGSKGLEFLQVSIVTGIICIVITTLILAILKRSQAEQGAAPNP